MYIHTRIRLNNGHISKLLHPTVLFLFQVDRSREAEGPYLENMVYGDHQ